MKNEYTGKGGKVYIANVTAQNHEVNFRLPEARKPLSLKIAMGRQVFAGDFSTPEIDAMVNQLGPYGLAELGQESKREKVAYLFCVGHPVPAAKMQEILDRNRGILRDEGANRRKEAAVAANHQMNTEETPMRDVDVSIEEVDAGSLGNDSEGIKEGFKIVDGDENAPKKRQRPARTPKQQ